MVVTTKITKQNFSLSSYRDLPRVVSYATITRDGWVNDTLPVTRALFDSGATANFISTSWAQRYAPHLVFESCDTYVLRTVRVRIPIASCT